MTDNGLVSSAETAGFWKRLALAFSTVGESYEERLESRVGHLEAEVSRISRSLEKPSPTAGPSMRANEMPL